MISATASSVNFDMPQSVWWITRNSRVPSSQLEISNDRTASSVALPPALRITCASPMSSPRALAGSIRASMQVSTAMLRAGGISRSPLSNASANLWFASNTDVSCPMPSPLLDRRAHERAVLGPRAVVVLDARVAEQLLQGEPRVARALADPAVRDDLAVAGDALALVQGPQLVRALERSVLVRRLGPRDVGRAGDVPRHLGLFLRKVVGSQLLAPELFRCADVDEPGLTPHLAEHLVAERPDLTALGARDREAGGGHRGGVLRELATLELPLLATAVQELHVVEPAELQDPVRVRREPVVVPSVQDHGGAAVDPRRREELGELGLVEVVPPHLRVQVGRPVPPDGAVDVALLVGLGVLIYLDHSDARVPHVLLEPVGLDERVGFGVSRHLLLLPNGTPATRKGAAARPLGSVLGVRLARHLSGADREPGLDTAAESRGDHRRHQACTSRPDHESDPPTRELQVQVNNPPPRASMGIARCAGGLARSTRGRPWPPRTSSRASTAGGGPSPPPPRSRRARSPGRTASGARSAVRSGSPSWSGCTRWRSRPPRRSRCRRPGRGPRCSRPARGPRRA